MHTAEDPGATSSLPHANRMSPREGSGAGCAMLTEMQACERSKCERSDDNVWTIVTIAARIIWS